jgi:hypothetical protein
MRQINDFRSITAANIPQVYGQNNSKTVRKRDGKSLHKTCNVGIAQELMSCLAVTINKIRYNLKRYLHDSKCILL